MTAGKLPLTKTKTGEILFQDKYGILELAALATLNRTPRLPKTSRFTHYLGIKIKRWVFSIHSAMTQWWDTDHLTEIAFLSLDPHDFLSELSWAARYEKRRKNNRPLEVEFFINTAYFPKKCDANIDHKPTLLERVLRIKKTVRHSAIPTDPENHFPL